MMTSSVSGPAPDHITYLWMVPCAAHIPARSANGWSDDFRRAAKVGTLQVGRSVRACRAAAVPDATRCMGRLLVPTTCQRWRRSRGSWRYLRPEERARGRWWWGVSSVTFGKLPFSPSGQRSCSERKCTRRRPCRAQSKLRLGGCMHGHRLHAATKSQIQLETS